ncbi:MAG: sugar ABC transporter substrate-binding protein [Planctomycetes bacterium]|nr:sugar ABC transporter substrate-binding protein [Planctomycetota bacterium]
MSIVNRVILSSIIIVVVAGCSSGHGPIGSKITTIKYSVPSTTTLIPLHKEIVESFQRQHSGIHIELEILPWSGYNERLVTRMVGDTSPDVWFIDGTQIIEWSSRGAIADLSGLFNGDLQSDDYYGIKSLQDKAGRQWGVPFSIQLFGLYYNKKIFDQSGVPYPDESWTYEDIYRYGERIMTDNKTSERDKIYGFTSVAMLPNLILSNGGHFLDENGTNSSLNQKEVVEAFAWARKLEPINPFRAFTQTFGGPDELFIYNRLAMYGNYYAFVATLNEKSPDLDYDVAPMPKLKWRNCYYVANALVVNRKLSGDKKIAVMEFIKHIVSYDNQMRIAMSNEGLPCYKKAAHDFLSNWEGRPVNMKAFEIMLKESVPLDTNKVFREWFSAFCQVADKFWGEGSKMTPEEAASASHIEVQTILDRTFR